MQSIKTYSIILLAFLTFTGCKKQTDLDLSGTYSLKPGQSLSIPLKRNLATITASDFTDSRCPINANCVWQGVGTAKFKFKDNNKEQTIELCIGGCDVVSKTKAQDITLNDLNYTVELTEISPYPEVTATTQIAKATIVLKRK